MDPTLLIGDIVERDSTQKTPVDFTDTPTSATGFPKHKRRWQTSTFKQRRAGAAEGGRTDPAVNSQGTPMAKQPQTASQQPDFVSSEKQRIDQDNRQKLASMTPAEIAQAQEDIMNGLNPDLVQRLLRRANIEDDTGPSPFDLPPPEPQEAPPTPPEIKVEAPAQEATTATSIPPPSGKRIADNYDEDQAPAQIPSDIFPISDLPGTTHFPAAPNVPDLDPADPNFLATLHEKYFPNLPSDPSKLAWMAPIPTEDSPADKDSSYYPHPEISVGALRFDFAGRFLSPRVSRSIPSSKGLHHHGQAPEAAGYTVAELAILARSSVPAQRCMAYQTLGRILYRLGQGEWGKTENDPIAMGIWNSVKEGRVLQSLEEAASGEGGHRGSRAYAMEAIWLFEKGGWREQFDAR
ncbi:hypothetical protein G7046_g2166 [Stylonectria norvegica]|nr:hypothetical protein G7046_g2166 [Stylonectria norvegica]